VVFSELMGPSALIAANYTLAGTGKGSLDSHPSSVAALGGNTYRLTWTSGEMFVGGDITITVVDVFDVAGNTLTAPTSGTASDAGIGNVPTVIAITPQTSSPTQATDLVFSVEFSENVSGFDTSDVAVNESGLAHTGVSVVAGSGSLYTVTVSGVSGNGALSLSVPAGVVADPAGNPNSAFGPSDGITVTSHVPAPSLSVIIEAQSSEAQSGDEIAFNVRVTNGGDADATGVTINIPMPENTEFVSTELTDGDTAGTAPQTSVADGVVMILLDVVPSGSQSVIRLVLRPLAAGEITLNAQVTSAQTPTPLDVPDSAPVDVTDAPVVKPPRVGCGSAGMIPLMGILGGLFLLTTRPRRS
jgi:uncharacterized repeat protein (TIGR01451 family)